MLEKLSLVDAEPLPKSFALGITCAVHGAGSTTAAQALAEILGSDYQYAGEYRRRLAVKLGCAQSIEDDAGVARFDAEIASEFPQTDTRLDRKIILQAMKGNCVFEGKVAIVLAKAHLCPARKDREQWYLAPIKTSLPIFTLLLHCDKETAARRILLRKLLHQQGQSTADFNEDELTAMMLGFSSEKVTAQMETSRERMAANRLNWEGLYQLSQLEQGEGKYDLEFDTTHLSKNEVVNQILQALIDHPQISGLLSDQQRKRIEERLS